MDKFNCTQCGACCKAIKCQHLIKENKCVIYSTRPFVCRVDDIYDKHKEEFNMSREEFYEWTEQHCNKLRKEHS